MPGRGRGRGRGRGKVYVPVKSTTKSGGDELPRSAQKRPTTTHHEPRSAPLSSNPLSKMPSRYNITPAAAMNNYSSPVVQAPPQRSQTELHVKDYPPPTRLYQTPLTQPSSSNATRLYPNPPPQHRQPQTPVRKTISNPELGLSPPRQFPSPPLQHSSGQSNRCSNNLDEDFNDDSEEENEEEEDEDEENEEEDQEPIDDTAQFEPDLEESRLAALNRLLSIPGRQEITSITTLSPFEPQPENTTW